MKINNLGACKEQIIVFVVSGLVGLTYALLTCNYSHVNFLGYLATFAAAGVAGNILFWLLLIALKEGDPSS